MMTTARMGASPNSATSASAVPPRIAIRENGSTRPLRRALRDEAGARFFPALVAAEQRVGPHPFGGGMLRREDGDQVERLGAGVDERVRRPGRDLCDVGR